MLQGGGGGSSSCLVGINHQAIALKNFFAARPWILKKINLYCCSCVSYGMVLNCKNLVKFRFRMIYHFKIFYDYNKEIICVISTISSRVD